MHHVIRLVYAPWTFWMRQSAVQSIATPLNTDESSPQLILYICADIALNAPHLTNRVISVIGNSKYISAASDAIGMENRHMNIWQYYLNFYNNTSIILKPLFRLWNFSAVFSSFFEKYVILFWKLNQIKSF